MEEAKSRRLAEEACQPVSVRVPTVQVRHARAIVPTAWGDRHIVYWQVCRFSLRLVHITRVDLIDMGIEVSWQQGRDRLSGGGERGGNEGEGKEMEWRGRGE